jgi:hypothetical protein
MRSPTSTQGRPRKKRTERACVVSRYYVSSLSVGTELTNRKKAPREQNRASTGGDSDARRDRQNGSVGREAGGVVSHQNFAVDRWLLAQSEAGDIAAHLSEGDYVVEWENQEDLPEMVVAELRKVLGERGLTLSSDDRGLRVTAVAS